MRTAARSSRSARAAGLVGGYLLDRVFADPRRGHPVAAFGTVAGAAQTRMYADSRSAGVAYVGLLVGTVSVAAAVAERLARTAPGRTSWWAEAAVGTLATYVVLGGQSLAREGDAMADLLDSADLPGARLRLAHLCARDAGGLDVDALARAALESIAENTSDAVVAPLLWGALAGPAGSVGYRAVNTLDAMVGYTSERYLRFGWAAARLDDLVNLGPARVTALLTVVTSPAVVGRAGWSRAMRVWRRDGGRHPSPNAGQVEAAFAGALDVTLGGTNTYEGHDETRGRLGEGPAPTRHDLRRSVRLSRVVGWAALAVSTAIAVATRSRR